MKTIKVKRRVLWLFHRTVEIPKPTIHYSVGGLIPCWVCSNGNGYPGFGQTQRQAWNDWANWALV